MPEQKLAASAAIEKKKEEPAEFLTKIGALGYPLADCAGSMTEIKRDDNEYRTFGFRDANGRKEIALTATKEQWKLWFEAALKS